MTIEGVEYLFTAAAKDGVTGHVAVSNAASGAMVTLNGPSGGWFAGGGLGGSSGQMTVTDDSSGVHVEATLPSAANPPVQVVADVRCAN